MKHYHISLVEILLTTIFILAVLFFGLLAYGSKDMPHPYQSCIEYNQSH